MVKRLGRILALTCAIQTFHVSVGSQSEATDLTDVLVKGFSFSALGLDTTLSARAVAPVFSASIAEAVRQVPVASGAPSFIYRFNPAVDIFERLTGVPGPLFSERALTLGKGQFDFSVGYSFIDFRDLNGAHLDNIRSPALINDVFTDEATEIEQLPSGEKLFAVPISGALIHTQLELQTHFIVPTLRYGITNDLEMSLSIPIVNTFLRVKNKLERVVDLDPSSARFLFATDAQGHIRILGFSDLAGNPIDFSRAPFIKSQRPPELLSKAAGDATGVGDIILRAKYYLWRSELGGAALGLNLQLPSGRVRDFHGTDETHLSPFLYLSQVFWKRLEPRLNIGVDLNANDVARSSFLYTAGATFLVGTRLGIIIDFLGRSEFNKFSVHVPKEGIYEGAALNRPSHTCTSEQPCFIDVARGPIDFPFFPVRIKRNDIIDFTFGLRYGLGSSGTIFFGGLVPINNDGLRADFIPTGGIEYLF